MVSYLHPPTLIVIMLAIRPKVLGFKPGLGHVLLRAIKSVARLPSKGKHSRRLKIPTGMIRDTS
jgi:hypothetical protein